MNATAQRMRLGFGDLHVDEVTDQISGTREVHPTIIFGTTCELGLVLTRGALDQDALPQILAANNIEPAPMSELLENADVRALVQKAINSANEAVSNSEAIKKFVILPEDLTIDNGYLTPKMSIRRHLIVQDFAQDIESLYA